MILVAQIHITVDSKEGKRHTIQFCGPKH